MKGALLFAAALFCCALGAVSSCDADCHKRGGVLVRGVFGYECVSGVRRMR